MGIEKINTIWPGLRVIEKINEGSDGSKYYRAVNESTGSEYEIKILSLPQSDAEIVSLKNEGMDAAQIAKYYNDKVTEAVNSSKLNASLNGVVSTRAAEECKVLARDEGIGWELYTRSELLIPLTDYLAVKALSEADVIKLGTDVAASLECCERIGILHKDIKPESIYLTPNGEFKLGGYSHEVPKAIGNYTSPEAAKGEEYTSCSDVYSLGMILYTLLNNNRPPLTDPNAEEITFAQRSTAAKRRLAGEELPAPCNASAQTANVILLALSHDPLKRFKNATAFKAALSSVAPMAGVSNISTSFKETVGRHAVPVTPVHNAPQKPEVTPFTPEFKVRDDQEIAKPVIKKKKKNSALPIIIISVIALLLVIGVIITLIVTSSRDNGKKTEESRADDIIEALENGYFGEALDAFEESGSDKDLVKGLKKRLDTLYDDFLNEKVGFDRAKQELDTIESMKITDIDEKFGVIRDKIYQLNDSRAAYARAEGFYKESDYIKAIEQYMLVIKDDPNYSEAQKKINSSKGEYRSSVIEECEALEEENEYADAIEMLQNALEVLKDDSELESKLESVEKSYEKYALNEAQILLDDKKYEEAEELLEKALDTLTDNEAITGKIEEIPSIIEKDYIEEAEELAEKGAYDSALKLLDEALEILPDNENIIAKKKEISDSQPVDMITLSIVDSTAGSSKTLTSSGTDVYGESYKSGLCFDLSSDTESYLVYDLGGKYTKFKGTVTLPSDADSESEFTVEIYADGKRLKRVKEYQMAEGAIDFNLDVSGASELEIRVALTKGEADKIYVVNGILSKD